MILGFFNVLKTDRNDKKNLSLKLKTLIIQHVRFENLDFIFF